MTTAQTAPAVAQEKKPPTIRQLIEGEAFKNQIAKALPSHMSPDRMIRVFITALTKTPKLAECDQGSLFASLLTCSQMGLEPDGRRAHLIPFENRKKGIVECQLIFDYKGLVELAKRNGDVADVHAEIVYDGDLFEYNKGRVEKHVPHFVRRDQGKPEVAGQVWAAYAIVYFKDGTEHCELLSRDEIEKVRQGSRAGQSGPWVTNWSEMAKKTAFRRCSKWITLSPELRDAVLGDDDVMPELKGATVSGPTYQDRQRAVAMAEVMPNATPVDPVTEPAVLAREESLAAEVARKEAEEAAKEG